MVNAFVANFKKNFIEMKRYFFDTVSSFIILFIIFYLIFFGFKIASGPNFGDTIDGIIVSYFMWIMFLASFQGVSYWIIQEAERGTLEQLFMSPIKFEFQMIFHVISDFCINVLMIVPLMYLAAFTTGRTLNFDLFTLLYLIILGSISAVGVGLILGGMALIFKKISSFIQICTFAFLAILMFEVDALWFELLPMVKATGMMRRMAVTGTNFYQFPIQDHIILWITAALFLLVGIIIFRVFEKRAMVKGTLGQY